MEQLQKIKNLLRIVLVCALVLVYSSCGTGAHLTLIYDTTGNRFHTDPHTKYQNKNLRKFKSQKHQKLKNGRHGRLYYQYMRPYKNNGRITKKSILRYHSE